MMVCIMTISMLAILLFSGPDLEGEAAFSYRVHEAAMNRGMTLADPGCALVDCSLLGAPAWIRVKGQWVGPLTSVDCGAGHDRAFLERNDRVVDLPWSLWQRLDLPLTPVRVEVSFHPPGDYPRRE